MRSDYLLLKQNGEFKMIRNLWKNKDDDFTAKKKYRLFELKVCENEILDPVSCTGSEFDNVDL